MGRGSKLLCRYSVALKEEKNLHSNDDNFGDGNGLNQHSFQSRNVDSLVDDDGMGLTGNKKWRRRKNHTNKSGNEDSQLGTVRCQPIGLCTVLCRCGLNILIPSIPSISKSSITFILH